MTATDDDGESWEEWGDQYEAPDDYDGDIDDRYETHLADQADAEYAALSPWGRFVYDWRNRRARRRSLKRYRKATKTRTQTRPDGFDTEPPF